MGEKLALQAGRDVARAVLPTTAAGRAKAAERARALAAKAKALAVKHQTALKATGVLAAGAAAYGITRKSKAGGALGDAIVRKVYERREAKEAAAMARFRAALRAERARGQVSSARVRELAKQSGL